MKHKLVLGTLAVGSLLVGGCSSSSGGTDPVLYRLGSGQYVVVSMGDGSNDECKLGIGIDTIFSLTIDNATGRTSLGRGPAAPCTATLGCGTISDNAGTLTSDTPRPINPCSAHTLVTSVLTLVGDQMLALDLTHTEDDRMSCGDSPDPCTSRFTLMLSPNKTP
ncbi:MAG: hypothetical protein ABIS92_03060 [Polyangia bacterium]